jgi:host factor-I protein
MNKAQANLQDIFLNQVRKEGIAVTIYLINSVQLRGMVRGFDTFTILLESAGRPTQLVYKSAVTSIVPMRPVNLRDAQAEARQQAQPAAPAGAEAPAGAAANGAPRGAAESGGEPIAAPDAAAGVPAGNGA